MKQPRKSLSAALAGLLMSVTVATAAVHPLPTPNTAGFIDTESSLNHQPGNMAQEGRRVKMTMTFNATPSNAVQVAWGQDLNGDEDLEPEETMLVLGVDCGVPFIREEVRVGSWRAEINSCSAGQQGGSGFPAACSEGDSAGHSSTSTSHFAFSFKQPSSRSERVDFAKVTTWGNDTPAPTITVEATRPGIAILLR